MESWSRKVTYQCLEVGGTAKELLKGKIVGKWGENFPTFNAIAHNRTKGG